MMGVMHGSAGAVLIVTAHTTTPPACHAYAGLRQSV